MTFHPRDPSHRPATSRRDFLRRAAATGIALPSAAAILAACGGDGTGAGGNGASTEVLFGTPENPVTLQTYDDVPPIASDLEPEAGPLVLYNWENYIWKNVAIKDFGEEFGVEVKVETFYNMEEAIQKIQTGQVEFDVFFPTGDVLPKMVAAKLAQPLNHDYLPNLKNIWPTLRDPFYDQGAQYSVPYAVYHTGFGWRTDLLPLEVEDVASLDNPYSVFWEHGVPGKTGVYDVSRDALALGMYHLEGDAADPNTSDPAKIDAAKQAMIELDGLVDLRVTIDGTYIGLSEAKYALHQAWSGDVVSIPWYTADPANENGLIRYMWPARDGFGGVWDNDMMAIPTNAKNPVLAHTFINYMLDNDHSMKNFSWTGYQAPLVALDPEDVVANGWPGLEGAFSWEYEGRWDNLIPAIVTEEDVQIGDRFVGLPLDQDTLWTEAFDAFKAGTE